MATIIFTSVSSVRAHHKKKAVRWDLVKGLAPGIVLGSLIGSLMVTTVTIILAALGCYEALGINTHCQLLELVPGLIAAAIFEEILFRGYVLQTIERASNTKIAAF